MTHLQDQLDEFLLLESVYSSPGEFEIQDEASHRQAEAYLQGATPHPPKALSCLLRIPISAHHRSDDEDSEGEDDAVAGDAPSHSVAISVRLPSSYPQTPPEVYVSANELKRRSQDELNSDLQSHIETLPRDEACLLGVAEWVRDNAATYFPIPCASKPEPEPDAADAGTDSHFCRMWLYMHHIYSKTKRRNILSLSAELELTGFCLPGKPGVVCVEGTVRSTREFYNILRRWHWKSIACRRREVEPPLSSLGPTAKTQQQQQQQQQQRRVEGFRELAFDLHGPRQGHIGHMDMGQFLAYLREHGLDYMFKELFGVEGHLTKQ